MKKKTKPLKFHAAVLTTVGGPLFVEEVSFAHPLQYGEVEVKVLASGLCGAQLQEINGLKGNARWMPHLLGHEGAGMVTAIGPGVTRVAPGDRVVMHWRKAAGIETILPPQYKFRGKTITSGRVVTLTERAIVSENRVTPVPQRTSVEACALLGCSLSTALSLVEKEAPVAVGSRVLIIGCGGLGLAMILAARLRHAAVICALDIIEDKRDLAHEAGADYFFSGVTDWTRASVLQDLRFDYVFDTVSAPLTFETAFPLLAPSGKWCMIGQTRPGDSITIPNAVSMFEGEGKTLFATQGGACQPHLDLPRYAKLCRDGHVRLDSLLTNRFALAEVNRAIDCLRDGNAGRILVIT